MKYVRFSGGNGFAGCDYEEYCVYEDDTRDWEIESDAENLCIDNAEAYIHLRFGFDTYSDEDFQDYIDDCYYDWEYVTENEYKAFKEDNG